jgi:hypothetical protein
MSFVFCVSCFLWLDFTYPLDKRRLTSLVWFGPLGVLTEAMCDLPALTNSFQTWPASANYGEKNV